MRVRGFRPGKTPRAVLERVYAASVAEEVERLLVNETFAAAVERSGVVPVVQPSIAAEPPKQGQAFRYTAEVEVKPGVELPALDGVAGVAAARRRCGTTKWRASFRPSGCGARRSRTSPRRRVAGDGSVLTVSYEGRIEGQPFEGGSAEGATVEIGSGRLVPGFEDGLRGVRRGEERDVNVTFPEDYGAADLQGKHAVFHVTVRALQRRRLPALDAAFAKDLGDAGIETMEALRERLREVIHARRERAAQETLRRTLLDALIERTPFEVPPGLVEQQLSQRLSTAHDQLHERMPHEELHARLAEWRVTWRPEAEREVREALLLEAVAAQQGLAAADRGGRAHRGDRARAGHRARAPQEALRRAQPHPGRARARSARRRRLNS